MYYSRDLIRKNDWLHRFEPVTFDVLNFFGVTVFACEFLKRRSRFRKWSGSSLQFWTRRITRREIPIGSSMQDTGGFERYSRRTSEDTRLGLGRMMQPWRDHIACILKRSGETRNPRDWYASELQEGVIAQPKHDWRVSIGKVTDSARRV